MKPELQNQLLPFFEAFTAELKAGTATHETLKTLLEVITELKPDELTTTNI